MYFPISSMGSSFFVVSVTLCSSPLGITSERKSINSFSEPNPHQGSGGSSYGGTQTPLGHGVCGSCGRTTSLNGGLFLLGQKPTGNGSLGLAPLLLEGGRVSSSGFVIPEFVLLQDY